MGELSVWAAVTGAAAACAGVYYLWEKARAAAFRRAAAALGLKAGPEGYDRLPETLKDLSLFKDGHSRRVENAFWSADLDWLVFDYRYSVGSGKNQATYRQTVGAFLCRGRNLPAFKLAPQDLLDWVAVRFGGQDIDFPQDPAFSKAYRLRGDDEAAVRDFFSVGGTQYLAARPGWTVEAQGDWLAATRAKRRVPPKKLRDFVWDLQGLYGALFGV